MNPARQLAELDPHGDGHCRGHLLLNIVLVHGPGVLGRQLVSSALVRKFGATQQLQLPTGWPPIHSLLN